MKNTIFKITNVDLEFIIPIKRHKNIFRHKSSFGIPTVHNPKPFLRFTQCSSVPTHRMEAATLQFPPTKTSWLFWRFGQEWKQEQQHTKASM